MWTPPPGWTQEHRNGTTVLSSQDGGRIVLHDGRRVVGDDLATLVRSIELPDFTLESSERIVTVEGERAVLASGRAGGLPIELGFILLDDTYSCVIGHASATVIRELVISTRVFLGSPRRRCFWYTGPQGWTRTDTGSGDVTWLAAGYPKQRASITVARALPIAAREHVSIVRQLLDGVGVPFSTVVTTHRRLTGSRWTRTITSDDGIELVLAVVALTDGVYDYFARAIMPATELASFEQLLESIEPVSAPPTVQLSELDVMSFWAS